MEMWTHKHKADLLLLTRHFNVPSTDIVPVGKWNKLLFWNIRSTPSVFENVLAGFSICMLLRFIQSRPAAGGAMAGKAAWMRNECRNIYFISWPVEIWKTWKIWSRNPFQISTTDWRTCWVAASMIGTSMLLLLRIPECAATDSPFVF